MYDDELDFHFDAEGDIYYQPAYQRGDPSLMAAVHQQERALASPFTTTSMALTYCDPNAPYDSTKPLAKVSALYVKVLLRLLTPPVAMHFVEDVHVSPAKSAPTKAPYSFGAESKFEEHSHHHHHHHLCDDSGGLGVDATHTEMSCSPTPRQPKVEEPDLDDDDVRRRRRHSHEEGHESDDYHPLARVPAAVVVHCAAGVGRTGCVLAACMLQIAVKVLEAIQVALRAAQPSTDMACVEGQDNPERDHSQAMTVSVPTLSRNDEKSIDRFNALRRQRLERCARLLQEFDWRRAISVLRLLRPGSIETPSQERILRQYYEFLHKGSSVVNLREEQVHAADEMEITVHSIPRMAQYETRHSYFSPEHPLAKLPFERTGQWW